MTRLPNRVVGDAYTSEFHWTLLEDLVDIGNRMAGQAGEREGAERVAEAFEAAGLRDVHLDEFDVPGWWRGSSTLRTTGAHDRTYEKDYEVIGLPGTPAAAATGDLVDVGYGRPEEFDAADCEGAVVLTTSETPADYGRWIHRMEKYSYAVEAGAVGFVFANHLDGCLPPTGEVGYGNRPGPIPAVGVSKEVGAQLRRHVGDDPTVSLDVDARNEPTTSVNTVGELGPDTDEAVLVTAHVDAHDIAPGANDNGAGTVLVAEIAGLLSAVEGNLDTRVRCTVFGSEEIGLRGAYHEAATLDLDDVKAVVNIDGAGRDRQLDVRTNRFDALEDVFETVTDGLKVPLSTSSTVSPHGDQWAFVQEGVPGLMASSTNPDKSGRGWGHTHADTLDKVDVRDLREHAVVLAEAVYELADADREVPRRSREEARDLIDEGYERELRVGGRWPYDDS
ncbi:M28 family peptidase [Candidatus Halobonum tyrrellensis]|uniref:Carboxypeptidase Q n=1 Tax=Candidatus Halobonum tyrrellensis G22 TaxID=1324957 RepID=V4HHS6_9EURY|nr:M28 family peptidase [Candidatus Halobonum tyrrellensis]ESP87464.1 peptidase M28 [Candidatus Halobonum tyrrellensis G22]